MRSSEQGNNMRQNFIFITAMDFLEALFSLTINYSKMLSIIVLLGLAAVLIYFFRSPTKLPTNRFRKRDKVLFFGRRMLRRVRNKRKSLLKFTKSKDDDPQPLEVVEPSQSFLEENEAVSDPPTDSLPSEVVYMVKSIRVFGLFDKPVFLELCKYIQVVTIQEDEYLFKIGDPDDSIYVLQSGRVNVFLTEPDGIELTLKESVSGDSIVSLLSVMDALTGHALQFKTVSAKAMETSILLKLKVSDFKDILDKYPESIARVTQIIMARLQRVTSLESILTGEQSVFSKDENQLSVITNEDFLKMFKGLPRVVLRMAGAVIKKVSPFVRQIDFAIDWIHLESGRAVYRQGDPSDSLYVLLSGRLRSVVTRYKGKREFVGEYGKGDLVGLVELVTNTDRSTTVMAVRDSEIAKLPAGLLEAIKKKYPAVVSRLINLLGNRILGHLRSGGDTNSDSIVNKNVSRPTGSDFATVAVLSNSNEVPLNSFCRELYHALTAIGPVLHLTSEKITEQLGATALEKAQEYKLSSWLGQQEDNHKIVLYQCDSTLTPWTIRCLRQADCILIVAMADLEPTVGAVEQQLEHLSVRTQKELILLHKDTTDKPKDSARWLNIRSWCSSHHHIRCPKRMFIRKISRIDDVYTELSRTSPPNDNDFARLARFLTGTSIGLVLGGGGARGAAHLGMIKAIREAGIPIDMIGGVSIGAFMGALWAQENDLTKVTQIARNWSYVMTSRWRQILDLTYPITAMFTGAAFNRTIHEVFGDRQIEDLWLPYFTLTTDITNSEPRIHRHGSLWRYVRSSMSLSGYLPPLCDPVDGHLLLDGGYVNNLPADVMHNVMGAQTILAVDVGSQDETDLTNYGDTLSGWWLLWNKWNPFAESVRVPSLPEIQSRLAYVSCVRLLEEVKRSDYCSYIRPPIDRYKTMQFGSFDDIFEVGYNHGTMLFSIKKNWKSPFLKTLD